MALYYYAALKDAKEPIWLITLTKYFLSAKVSRDSSLAIIVNTTPMQGLIAIAKASLFLRVLDAWVPFSSDDILEDLPVMEILIRLAKARILECLKKDKPVVFGNAGFIQ